MTARRCEVDLGGGAVIRFTAYDFAKLEDEMGKTTPEIYQEAHAAWVEGRATALVKFLDVGIKQSGSKVVSKEEVVQSIPLVDLAMKITDALTMGYYGKTLEELAEESEKEAEEKAKREAQGEVEDDPEGKPKKATGSET